MFGGDPAAGSDDYQAAVRTALVALVASHLVLLAWWTAGGRLLTGLEMIASIIVTGVLAIFHGNLTWARLLLLWSPAFLSSKR
jgi:hypothetical protein